MAQLANTLYTNASPPVHPITADFFQGQCTKRIITTFTITNGDEVGSTYFLGALPDNAIVENITIDGPLATGAEGTVGLYDFNGIVKEAACYSGTVNLTSNTGTSVSKFGGSNYSWSGMTALDIVTGGPFAAGNTCQQPVWQLAGDVTGPAPASNQSLAISDYQLGFVLTEAATATTTYACLVEYTCAE